MGNRLSEIEEFYEFYKEETNLDIGTLRDIIRAPFSFLKSEMSQGTLKPYRFQYFGTFFIPKNRVAYAKKNLENSLQQGKIDKAKYDKRLETLNKYVEENHY